MNSVHRSLENLLGAIERLDHATNGLEAKAAGRQPDMFMEPSNENNVVKEQNAAIAQRLDVAIERVEKILEDSAATG